MRKSQKRLAVLLLASTALGMAADRAFGAPPEAFGLELGSRVAVKGEPIAVIGGYRVHEVFPSDGLAGFGRYFAHVTDDGVIERASAASEHENCMAFEKSLEFILSMMKESCGKPEIAGGESQATYLWIKDGIRLLLTADRANNTIILTFSE